jgi:hypothetical protein
MTKGELPFCVMSSRAEVSQLQSHAVVTSAPHGSFGANEGRRLSLGHNDSQRGVDTIASTNSAATRFIALKLVAQLFERIKYFALVKSKRAIVVLACGGDVGDRPLQPEPSRAAPAGQQRAAAALAD